MGMALRDVCTFRSGGTPSKSNSEFWGGDIPWISPKDMKTTVLDSAQDFITLKGVEGSATSLVPKGSILTVVRSGILAHTVPFAVAGRSLAFNQDIKAIQVTSDQVTSEYVYWFLRSKEPEILARGVKKGATVHSVQSGFLEKLVIPVLPRAEQQKIVDLLARAENIVQIRRDAEEKAKEIIPALFLDMFGDPAANPKGWDVKRVDGLTSVGTGGTPSRKRPDYYGGTIPWVKTAEVEESTINTTGESITVKALEETNCKIFPVGTIVIAMYGQGQTRGRTGILGIEAATNQACAAVLPSNEIDGLFLYWVFRLQYERLRAMGRGGNQANLNLSMIKSFKVPVPSRALQRAFSTKVTSYDSISRSAVTAMRLAEQAFQSLLAGVFGQ
jgi:type I restriction enzyme S subunit